MSVLRVFADHGALAMLKNCTHNHKEVKELIFVAQLQGYHLLTRATQHQKEVVCQYIYDNHLGPRLLPSLQPNCFFSSNHRVAIQSLINALHHANIPSVCLAVYGQKQPLDQVQYLNRATIVRFVPARYDIGFEVRLSYIPSLTTSYGTTFPMFGSLGRGGGSVKLTSGGIKVKVYPVVMHVLKSTVKNCNVPLKIVTLKNKVAQLKQYLRQVRHCRTDILCGYRAEACIVGNYTLRSATVTAQRIFAAYQSFGITAAAKISPAEYCANLENAIMKAEGHLTGQDSLPPSKHQIHLLSNIYNAAGYWSEWWARHLQPATSISQPTAPPVPLPLMTPELADIYNNILVRHSARNRSLLCSATKSGACTRGFSTLLKLSEHILAKYGTTWRDHVSQQQGPSNRQIQQMKDLELFESILRPFQQVLGAPIQQVIYNTTTYALFNVPDTSEGLFLVAAAVLQTHLNNMPSTLIIRQVLSDFYGLVATFSVLNSLAVEHQIRGSLLDRYDQLNDPSFKAGLVDVHALACHYNVSFRIVDYNPRVTTPIFYNETILSPIHPIGTYSVIEPPLPRLIVRTAPSYKYNIAIPLVI